MDEIGLDDFLLRGGVMASFGVVVDRGEVPVPASRVTGAM